jgi:hypothetical protein
MSATSVAIVPTDKAQRYMSQLVKHFAHKAQTGLGDETGHIAFDFGRCDLDARADRLAMTASALDPQALVRLENVIVRHLQRFAFREPVAVAWVR